MKTSWLWLGMILVALAFYSGCASGGGAQAPEAEEEAAVEEAEDETSAPGDEPLAMDEQVFACDTV